MRCSANFAAICSEGLRSSASILRNVIVAQPTRRVAEDAADYSVLDAHAAGALIKKLEAEMYKRAQDLEFEEAARLRDEIHRVREQALLQ